MKELAQLGESCYKSLESLNKSSLVEMKALTSPPLAVVLVAEACCYLFSVTANWSSFKKLLSQSDFHRTMITFDWRNISDFALGKLKPYIEKPDFNPEYTMRVSQGASVICSWVIGVYNLKVKSEQLNEGPGSVYATIGEFLIKNSYFMFWWPVFYPIDLNEAKITDQLQQKTKINANKLANLNGEKFLSIQKFLLNNSSPIENDNYYMLNEKYLLSEFARVNFLLNF